MKYWLWYYKEPIIALLIIISAFSLLVWLIIYKQDLAQKRKSECEVLCKNNGYPLSERSEDVCKCFHEPKLFRIKGK